MKKLKVSIHLPNKNEKPIEWPYDQIPRVGDKFCFEVGVHFPVTDVFYTHIPDGSDFSCVVVLGHDTRA